MIPYRDGLLEALKKKEEIRDNKAGIRHGEQVIGSDNQLNQHNQLNLGDSDVLALYLSTIDAFGMASLEAQIAGLPAIILDK